MELTSGVRYAKNTNTGVVLVWNEELAGRDDIVVFTNDAPIKNSNQPLSKKQVKQADDRNDKESHALDDALRKALKQLHGGEVDSPQDYAAGGIPKMHKLREVIVDMGFHGNEVTAEYRNKVWSELLEQDEF